MKMMLCMAVSVPSAILLNTFGEYDASLLTLVIFMIMDFICGLIVAGAFKKSQKSASGGISSSECRKGLYRKAGILLVLIIANRLDILVGTDYIQTTVCIGFIVNECISIFENLSLMGVPMPAIIKKTLDVLQERNEDNGKRN